MTQILLVRLGFVCLNLRLLPLVGRRPIEGFLHHYAVAGLSGDRTGRVARPWGPQLFAHSWSLDEEGGTAAACPREPPVECAEREEAWRRRHRGWGLRTNLHPSSYKRVLLCRSEAAEGAPCDRPHGRGCTENV